MKIRIRNLISFVLLSATSLTLLFGSPNTPPSGNPQTAPAVTVPSIVKPGSDKGDMRTRADTLLPSVRYRSQIDLNQPSVNLDPLDIRSFTLEPNQVGVNRSVEVSPNTRAQKFANPDGSQIIALIIKSSGSSGIGVHFRNFALAEGEEVYVYGAAPDSIVFGPYTNEGPWGSGEFWSGTIDGDTMVIEFYSRPDENGKGFEIFESSHIFTERDWRTRSNQPDVGPCEVDASCNPVSENNAVGRILFNDNGVFVCTGTLLNDLVQDHCPYFLTENYCVATQAVAQTVEVYWFYRTTACNSGVLRNWVHSPPGANLLVTQSSNDFTLLRLLSDPPAGVVFAAWDPNPQPTGTAVFGLHHPGSGDPEYQPLQSYLRRSGGTITETNASCIFLNGYETHWTSGTTEGGSDGSGLFTWNGHRLVGILSCYMADPCGFPDSWYSKFSNFYPQIQPYIGANPPRTSPPLATAATLVKGNSFTANWKPACSATSYRLDVATNNSFTNYVPGYQNLDVGNVTSRSVSSLNPGITYYYRVRAFNSAGTSGNSNIISVRTLAIPVVSTLGALFVGTSSATLSGQVNPNGLGVLTEWWFQYGETTNYGKQEPQPHQFVTGGNQPVRAEITGLKPTTTYHFRINARNTYGNAIPGVDRTFTTLRPFNPTVTTDPATNVASSSATLNGRVNPQGLSTIVRFQYGKTLSYELGFTGPQTKNGNTTQPVSANITNLDPDTMYHFRIRAQHIPYNPAYGYDRTFRTRSPTGPPVVTTKPATNVASSSATLNGSVYPHGLSTTVWFKWGRTTNYELGPTPNQTKTGNNYQNISANISGLTANITYHFRVCADNDASPQPVCDGDRTFTAAALPVVTTNPATNLTNSSATLNGTVNPKGSNIYVFFQYGRTMNYELPPTPMQAKTGNTVQPVSANISGLSANTLYHFRIVARKGAAPPYVYVYGLDRTFTTPSAPAPLTGRWTGTWQWSGPGLWVGCIYHDGGSFSMTLTQDGSSFSGGDHGDGIQCLRADCTLSYSSDGGGSISGTISGTNLRISFDIHNSLCDFGRLNFTGTATLNNNTITASFVGDTDTGGSGSFRVTRE